MKRPVHMVYLRTMDRPVTACGVIVGADVPMSASVYADRVTCKPCLYRMGLETGPVSIDEVIGKPEPAN